MTSLQLADKDLPVLKLSDSTEYALEIMQKFTCNHLPVVEDSIFKGLVSKVLLMHQGKSYKVMDLANEMIPASVNGSAHFLKTVAIANLYRSDVVPVVTESSEYLGSVTHIDLINALGRFCGAGEYGAVIVLEIEKSRLNVSELNSVIESNGATILHYNISPIAATSIMEVTLGLDKKEIATILASLIRYNYKILYSTGEDVLESELSDNYLNLMNYLDI